MDKREKERHHITNKKRRQKNNSITYHARHGSIDDDVRGDVQVCDALSGVNHGQPGALLVAGVQVKLHLLACLAVKALDLFVPMMCRWWWSWMAW